LSPSKRVCDVTASAMLSPYYWSAKAGASSETTLPQI